MQTDDQPDSERPDTGSGSSVPTKLIFDSELWTECPKDKC